MESDNFSKIIEDLPSELHKNTSKNFKEKTNVDVHQSLKTPDNLEKRKNLPKQNLHSSNIFEADLEMISLDDQCVTPHAQNHTSPSSVRRWASVVKAKKKLLPSETSVVGTDINKTEIDCVFKNLSKSVQDHQGFISRNQSTFSCDICNTQLESVLTLSNHLKTRKHEDNIITCLKEKLPPTLYHVLEFVSFYGSNLCCNLCRCKIELSSYNLYETIVNIVAHNIATDHNDHKSSQETDNEANKLISSLASTYSEIQENICYIEKKMRPLYKCKLCAKNIMYSENINTLVNNFMHHLKSAYHLNNQRAFETLKLYSEKNVTDQGFIPSYFTVKKGKISCDHCNLFIESDVDKMICHVNEIKHTEHNVGKVNLTPTNIKCAENESIIEENQNLMNKFKSITVTKSETEKKDYQNQFRDNKFKSRLSDVKTHSDLSQTNHVIENEGESVSCKQDVPLNVHSVRTHIVGSTANKIEHVDLVPEDEGVIEGNKLNELQQEFGNILDSKNKTSKNEVTCLVCQLGLNFSSDSIQEHLLSVQHRDKEFACLLKCPVCSRKVMSMQANTNAEIHPLKLLKSFRKVRCLERQILSTSTQNEMYSWLLNKNALVFENRDFLETNIDGMHIYCKLCKALIQYSIYLNKFEINVTKHLQGKVHITNVSKKISETIKSIETKSSNPQSIGPSPKNLQTKPKESKGKKDHCISLFKAQDKSKSFYRSLYAAINKNAIMSEDTKLPILSDASECNPLVYLTASEDKSASSQAETVQSVPFVLPSVEIEKNTSKRVSDVTLNSTNSSCESVARKVPSSAKRPCLLTFKEETSEDVIKRREKQIEYGKNTLGYMRYCTKVPKSKRRPHQPETPPKHLKCSRRTWDEMVRVWRRRLHDWDPPALTAESLSKDIQPLT